MPGIVAFVVIGLIPLSALASWTHCVSFCSPQEGRTGASVFGLAMSKSALLVPMQDGCTHLSPLPLYLSLCEKHCLLSLSALGRRPFHVWTWAHDGCHSSPVLQSCQLEMVFTKMLLSVRVARSHVNTKRRKIMFLGCALRTFMSIKNF